MAVLRFAIVVATIALTVPAAAGDHGSVTSFEPVGDGGIGMSVSGGYALALPFIAYEMAYGVSDDAAIGARYETIVGLLHFPQLHAQWAPIQMGSWRAGGRIGVAYSFFGLQTEDLNLTSTLYLPVEVGVSGPVTKHSDLVFAVGGELDLARFLVVDGESESDGDVRYDASIVRFGLVSALTPDLDLFVQGRLRVPIETVTDGQHEFFIVPYIEGGGTWAF